MASHYDNGDVFFSGQSLGYGFVNFYSERDAERAVRAFNGYRLHNKQIKVCFLFQLINESKHFFVASKE